MKKFLSLLLCVLFVNLAGCATAKKIIGPDGTANHLISCHSTEYCYEKAREVCGGNYKIVNTSTESSGANGVTSSTTNLLVKCDN